MNTVYRSCRPLRGRPCAEGSRKGKMVQSAGATDRRRGVRRQKGRLGRKSHKCRAGHIVFVLVTGGKGILVLRNRNGKSHCGTILFLVSRRGSLQLWKIEPVADSRKKTIIITLVPAFVDLSKHFRHSRLCLRSLRQTKICYQALLKGMDLPS